MNPILAAGVVVLRDGAGEREVLTVHRPHRSDWSLPKGKLEPGEHPIVTAVRECDEETGYTVTLGSPLPTLDYEVNGEPKRVWYWRADVRNNEEFIPDDEVDEIRWVPLSDTPTALSYPSDIATVTTAAATPRTSPFILLRHTQAMKRADFKGSLDAERPLSGKGRTQSKALVPLLDAYGITEVHASDTTRCVETVRRYAKSIAVDVHREDTLTESGHERHPNRTKRRIVELAERPEPIVVCSHRPVLPTVIQALQRHLNWPDIPEIWDPKLPPGGFIVVHRAFTENGHIEPIAVERHTLSR